MDFITEKFDQLLQIALLALAQLGNACIFFFEILRSMTATQGLLKTAARQLLTLLLRSVLMIGCSALCVGVVLFVQICSLLEPYKLTSFTSCFSGGMAIGLAREFAPVLTALLFIGMVGSALAAEIALMKTTNQLDCLEIMGIDPKGWIFAPRLLAVLGLLPLLTQMFLWLALGSGAIVSIHYFRIDSGIFWRSLEAVSWLRELMICNIKSFSFAAVIGWVTLFEGYQAAPHSEGISKATTNAVVQSVLIILVINVLLTFVFI